MATGVIRLCKGIGCCSWAGHTNLSAKQRFLVCTPITFLWVMFTITALAMRVWTKAWDSAFVSDLGFKVDYEVFCVSILCQLSGLGFYFPALA